MAKIASIVIAFVALIGIASASLHANDLNIIVALDDQTGSMASVNGTNFRATEVYSKEVTVQMINQVNIPEKELVIDNEVDRTLTSVGNYSVFNLYQIGDDYVAILEILGSTVTIDSEQVENVIYTIDRIRISQDVPNSYDNVALYTGIKYNESMDAILGF